MIMEQVSVSKSTLSNWLSDHPLSKERIRELQADSSQRIEKFRNTMREKKRKRREEVRQRVEKDLGKITKRELFLAGLFLYWGEGLKAESYTTSLANTDPAMVAFFVKWLEKCFGINRCDLKVKLHLYSDMKEPEEITFWSQLLSIPKKNFQKSYIKSSFRKDLSYKFVSKHGTCNVNCYGRDVAEYVREGVECLKNLRP